MSRPANPAVIGGFVVGSVTLLVAGLLLLGKGDLLSEHIEYVIYFDGNLSGLDVGAPVEYHGVRVGAVSDLKLVVDVRDHSIHLPVTILLDPDRVTRVGDYPGREAKTPQEFVQMLMLGGLRAQLRTQSLVTGKLRVDLALYPNSPFHRRDFANRPEIPSVPSTQDVLTDKLKNIPIEELVIRSISAVTAIERIVESKELKNTITSFKMTARDMSTLMKSFEKSVIPTMAQMEKTFRKVEILSESVDVKFKTMTDDFSTALVSARSAFERAESAVASIEGTLEEDSPVRYELSNSLREISTAAQSIRVLAEYLGRHPEALLSGKGAANAR